MYPYGNAAGDSLISFDTTERKCFKIVIPDGGMAFFGKRHRKLHVSLLILYIQGMHEIILM